MLCDIHIDFPSAAKVSAQTRVKADFSDDLILL
jgi:hypothetical protein